MVKVVLDQGSVGSCATESTSQSVMMTRNLQGQEFELLNPWSLYFYSSGGVDRGSSIDENLRLAREKGIAPERVWPRSNGWRTRPSDEATQEALKYRLEEFYDIQTVEEIGSALLRGFVVVFGWSGHSVAFTELISQDRAIYINSWGDRWGAQGFGELDLDKVNFRYGAYAVRTALFSGMN
jgi:hypothetical protein